MANITDVKLPDNSQYDLKDNISGYAKKVAGATTDDLASLTATGDLADSGKKLSDLVLKSDVKDVLNSTSTTDPLSANQGRLVADNLTANENVYGAKNLNSYPYYHGNRYTNGITFTDNGDGTITATGTAIADAMFAIHSPNITEPPIVKVLNGNYILTGCPSVSGCEIRLLQAAKNTGTIEILGSDTGDGATFTIDGGYYSDDYSVLGMRIYVANGTALPVGGITFYPMLRDARILDPTFVPYAETNLQLTHKTSGLSNENFLDNPFFTVNQRSSNSYSSPDVLTNVYTVDRWYVFNGQLSVSSNGVTFVHNTNANWGRLVQKLESAYIGRTLTLSILDDNGDIYEVSGVATNGGYLLMSVNSNWRVSVDFSTTGTTVSIASTTSDSSISIRAIKLEVGSVSTLANDVAPNYTTELLKCQRYFYRLGVISSGNIAAMANRSAYTAYLVVNLPAPMRATPTVSYAGTFSIYHMSTLIAATSIALGKVTSQIMAGSVDCAGGLTAGYGSALYGETGAYIDFSADL